MKYVLLALLILYPGSGFAEEPEKKDPIEIAMDAATDRDPSTAGMVRAYSDANTKWDKKMNAAYKSLKAKMDSDEWTALVQAQKAWLAFRDLQFKSINATFGKMEGTMWIPVSAYKSMEITRERALFLDSLVETLSER